MMLNNLIQISQSLLPTGKGILALDEDEYVAKEMFKNCNVKYNQNLRTSFIDLLINTNDLEQYISGIIFSDKYFETFNKENVSMVKMLSDKGILSGIRMDNEKVEPATFARTDKRKIEHRLMNRLNDYYKNSIKFVKWRSLFNIGIDTPCMTNIQMQTQNLITFVTTCHKVGLLPIIEPEIIIDGRHTIQRCEDVTTFILKNMFIKMQNKGLNLEAVLLNTNMITPGKDCPQQLSPEQIAKVTVRCMRRTVPSVVPGILFVSGGQSPIQATNNLNAINSYEKDKPWTLTFSFGRALQEPTLKTWKGDNVNRSHAQNNLIHRAVCNSAATSGAY